MDESAVQARDAQADDVLVFGPDLHVPWLMANVVGFGIAGAAIGAVLGALATPIATGMSAVIQGTIIGTFQWLVLRRFIRVTWWIPATVLGWVVAFGVCGLVVAEAASTSWRGLVSAVVVPLLFLLVHGSGQWLVLRGRAEAAGWWPLFHGGSLVAAWMLGLTVAAMFPLVAGVEFPSARVLAVIGVVGGLLYGWLTGLFLGELRSRTDEWRS